MTGDFRSPLRAKALFGVALSGTASTDVAELPHHRQMRIEQTEAAEQSAAARTAAEAAKAGEEQEVLGSDAAPQSVDVSIPSGGAIGGHTTLALPDDSDDDDDSGEESPGLLPSHDQ